MVGARRAGRRLGGGLALLLLALPSADAWAQEPEVGDGPNALAGIHRIGVVEPAPHSLAVAAATSYGFTEGVLSGQDSHHRWVGALAASYRPIPWLAIGASGRFRYDSHLGPPDDGDSGWVLEPSFRLRGGWVLPGGVRLGAEATTWLPAADSRSSLADAASFEAVALAAYAVPETALLLALHVGYRVDRSGGGAVNSDALSRSDRLALGVSDFHAVPVGLGASYRVGPVEVLAEWTWDVLVGEGAPEPASWPMRVAAGARYWVLPGLQASLVAEASPSARPALDDGASLVVVEPVVTILVGVGYRIPFDGARGGGRDVPDASGAVRGVVSDGAGRPIGGARVVVGEGEGRREATTDGEGAFEIGEIPLGEQPLSVVAEGYADHRATIAVDEAGGDPLGVVLEPLPGAIRGQVLAPNDSPIRSARVRVTRGEAAHELEVDREGRFSLEDLEVGTWRITATADAFQEGSMEVEVMPGATAEPRLALDRAFPAGQLRGEVRAVDGTPLAEALVHISPIDRQLRTDEAGEFEVDIPPGRYRVYVSAEGYARQRRSVVIEENGVTLLNVDLRPERRRRR